MVTPNKKFYMSDLMMFLLGGILLWFVMTRKTPEPPPLEPDNTPVVVPDEPPVVPVPDVGPTPRPEEIIK